MSNQDISEINIIYNINEKEIIINPFAILHHKYFTVNHKPH